LIKKNSRINLNALQKIISLDSI